MINLSKEQIPEYESIIPKSRLGKLAWNLEHIAGFALIGAIVTAPFVYATYQYKPLPQSIQQYFDKTLEQFTFHSDKKSPQSHDS